jgi:S1-C subfamily serine protease
MNLVDWLIVVLAIVVAYTGWSRGFLVGLLSFVGFVGGALAGLWLIPRLLGSLDAGLGTALLGVLLVLAMASLGQGLLAWAGSWIRAQLTSEPARHVDAASGALLSVFGLLVAAWAIGFALSTSAVPYASAGVRESAILRYVGDVVPISEDRLQATFQNVVASGAFPDVVAPWVPEPIVAVDPPTQTLTRDAEIEAASSSVLKVVGRAPECNRIIEGSSFVVAPERVMTNAHVVAGVTEPKVWVGDNALDARVVVFNPFTDVAVLAVPGLERPVLAFTQEADAGADAAVVGYPNNGPLSLEPARVRGEHALVGRDIYGESETTRDVLAVRGSVRQGNSGGPLIADDGTVYGVIFAASMTDPDTGYALAYTEVARALETGTTAENPVSTGRCI